jgi:hypothetical protein
MSLKRTTFVLLALLFVSLVPLLASSVTNVHLEPRSKKSAAECIADKDIIR